MWSYNILMESSRSLVSNESSFMEIGVFQRKLCPEYSAKPEKSLTLSVYLLSHNHLTLFLESLSWIIIGWCLSMWPSLKGRSKLCPYEPLLRFS